MSTLQDLPLPDFQHRPILAWTAGAAALLGIAASALFIYGTQRDDAGSNYYVPHGYLKQVNEIADARAIRHETTGVNERGALPPWGQLVFDPRSANPRQQSFAKESQRLRRDLSEFNDTGDGFFEIKSDGAILISQSYHNFALPYPPRPQFHGNVSLGGESLPSLVSPSLSLSFSTTEQDGTPTAEQYKILPLSRWTKSETSSKTLRSPAYELAGDEGHTVLNLYMLGDRIILRLVDTAQCRVYLNGEVINQPGTLAVRNFLKRRDELKQPNQLQANAAPLQDGDRLRIRHLRTGIEIPFRFGRYAGGSVSRRWIADGKEANVIDPELSAELPYFQQLQESLDHYVRACKDPGSIGSPNVRLTVDRTLHSAINRIFLDYVRLFDHGASGMKGLESEPACITILNALNGDVLAMPSYPAPDDIATLRKRAQAGAASAITEAKLHRLSLNQNLALVPIGSTTKPLLATAIWDTYPEFSKLVVHEEDGHRSTFETMGYTLASPFGTRGPRRVDSTGFLRMSSNDYTMHLGLLMLANDPHIDANGAPSFPGNKADLSAFLRSNGDEIPGGLNSPRLPAFKKLEDCFDVGLVEKLDGGSAEKWEAGPLAPMFSQIGATGENLYRSFNRVLPQRANLHLDQIHSIRGNYTSTLLGSGTNYWSNLKLAEAYARIGTGRKIIAHLAVDSKQPATLDHFSPLPVKPETLQKVYAGMQECVSHQEWATASAIADTVDAAKKKYAARGLSLFVIGKTGTAGRIPEIIKNGVVLQEKRECAAFCVFMEVRDTKGTPLAALVSATYLQDRGFRNTHNSVVAVKLTEDFFPELLKWLDEQPGVRSAMVKMAEARAVKKG